VVGVEAATAAVDSVAVATRATAAVTEVAMVATAAAAAVAKRGPPPIDGHGPQATILGFASL
jgi:hypothetical protein